MVYVGKIAIALAVFSILCVAPANGHDAPSGWPYPFSCCSGVDCHHISKSAVKEVTGGYRVTLSFGEHPILNVKGESHEYFIPFDKVKQSQDEDFHICLKQYAHNEYICFYAPPMSF